MAAAARVVVAVAAVVAAAVVAVAVAAAAAGAAAEAAEAPRRRVNVNNVDAIPVHVPVWFGSRIYYMIYAYFLLRQPTRDTCTDRNQKADNRVQWGKDDGP